MRIWHWWVRFWQETFRAIFAFKKHFFPPVINRLKTSEIVSVILRPGQVVARTSVPASAAAPGRHCPAPRVATTRPVPQPGWQETARNSQGGGVYVVQRQNKKQVAVLHIDYPAIKSHKSRWFAQINIMNHWRDYQLKNISIRIKQSASKTVIVWETTFFFTLQRLQIKGQTALPRTALLGCVLFVFMGNGHLDIDSHTLPKN